jgi:phosphatidyl-myo-inositol alpha-mannosyltransferase
LEARKGVDILLRAWPAIAQAVSGARLVLIGDGAQRQKIDRIIEKLSNVERRSSLSQPDLDLLLAQASIAFCPSYLEGFGLACAEAMAAGCCVIASNTDGLRSLIDDASGILVPAGDSLALADAAMRVLRNPPLRASIGAVAVTRIRRLCDPATSDAAFAAAL